MRKQYKGFIVTLIFILMFSGYASANEVQLTDTYFVDKTKKAHEIQISLSENGYTYEQFFKLMQPYFTTDSIKTFMKEHMYKENDKYFILGTDFPVYYVPSFTYSDETQVIIDIEKQEAVVYEFFHASMDGPVGYNDHYEAVSFTKEEGEWKIAEIIIDYKPEMKKVIENNKEKTLKESVTPNSNVKFHKQEERNKESNFFEKITAFFLSIF